MFLHIFPWIFIIIFSNFHCEYVIYNIRSRSKNIIERDCAFNLLKNDWYINILCYNDKWKVFFLNFLLWTQYYNLKHALWSFAFRNIDTVKVFTFPSIDQPERTWNLIWQITPVWIYQLLFHHIQPFLIFTEPEFRLCKIPMQKIGTSIILLIYIAKFGPPRYI